MKRGDIWLINLDPTIGAEIKKTRPAIIISHNDLGVLPLKLIIPITEWKSQYEIAPWMVNILPDTLNCLSKHSSADCYQIRSVSIERFINKIGVIENDILQKIEIALFQVLDLKL
jgi:mRNA interferase MazF